MYYRHIVLFETQNHSPLYRASYPQIEMIRNSKSPKCLTKMSFPPVSMALQKKIHQQCILKPFFLVFFCHSVHFLARRTEMVNSSSRTVGKALVPGPRLARTLCAYVELCKMNDTNTYLKTTTHHCAWYIGRETHWGPLSKLTSQKHLDAFFPLVQCGICGCPSDSDLSSTVWGFESPYVDSLGILLWKTTDLCWNCCFLLFFWSQRHSRIILKVVRNVLLHRA